MTQQSVLADLKSRIGTEIFTSDWITVEQAKIDAFAAATDDHQWIHTDPQRAAKDSPYGATIAHGYLIISLYPQMRRNVDDGVPVYSGVKSSINYGLNKLRFPNAVRAGSRVRGHTELVNVKQIRNAIQMIEKLTVEIEGEEKPACVAEAIVWLVF
ncbi:MAG: MaoC family dehydratase [Gammaproteobacteria bacterium]|nr:MaoC family dehydratase [Gammaproteobacteria bacterium]